VTVAAPKRRIDVALPDNALVIELLPPLLRQAGEELTGDEEQQGGWTLRRATGAELEASRNLAAQGVRDGELLHLVPREVDWPELAYDDVVEVVASGARKVGRSWGHQATRRCGFALASALLVVGVLSLQLSGPPWLLPGLVGLAFAAALTIAGWVLSRAGGDATAGVVLAGAGLLYALVGGLMVAVPAGVPLTRIGAPHVLLGSAALTVFGVFAMIAVGAGQRVFTAGVTVGIAGMLAALLGDLGSTPAGAAAVVVTLAVGLLPGYPLIASWLGKLPIPELPVRPEQILEDQPTPARTGVFAAVARSTELLSGMLLAAALVGAVGCFVLIVDGRVAGALLSLAVAAALLLRGRLFALPRQRVPLLTSGVTVLALLTWLLAVLTHSAGIRLLVSVGIVVAATVVLGAGMKYSKRAPSPYLGRLADIVDVLAIMALIPLAGAVLGVYDAIRGVFASF
jgi:type VII secretion integral membrane protein EccD